MQARFCFSPPPLPLGYSLGHVVHEVLSLILLIIPNDLLLRLILHLLVVQ